MFYEQMKTEDHGIHKRDKLIIGVSGGPDSMGLLHFLICLKDDYELDLVVAHVNHHTRGEENIKEEKLIQDYCIKYNIPCHIAHFKERGNGNFHDEARKFRYDFFLQLTKDLNGNKIVLAHHEDDQIETILFKLARGNTISGYLGMSQMITLEDGIQIIRPFLNYTKQEIIHYCDIQHIPYAIDSSNLKNKYTRNHIRNKIIPLFKEIQPDFNHKMMQFHDQLAEVNDFLQENVKILLPEMIILSEKDRIILDLKKLKVAHRTLIRNILLDAVNKIIDDHFDFTYEKMKNILHIIFNDKPNVTFDLGKDVYCIKQYEQLIFQVGQKSYEDYTIELIEFKDYELPNGMKIRVKKVEEKAKTHNKNIFLCYNSTIWPLVIRTKNEGDYIKTKIGKKKINRIFIDEKIPMNLRKTWPLLCDKEGNVLWVIGLQKPDFTKYPDCQKYILIEVLN